MAVVVAAAALVAAGLDCNAATVAAAVAVVPAAAVGDSYTSTNGHGCRFYALNSTVVVGGGDDLLLFFLFCSCSHSCF